MLALSQVLTPTGLLFVWFNCFHVSYSNATCKIPSIVNGKIKQQDNNNVFLPGNSAVEPGTAVTVICDPGFALQFPTQSEAFSNNPVFVCLSTTAWNPSWLTSVKCSPDSQKCGTSSRVKLPPKVYGGRYAASGEFPWMAKLEVQYRTGEPGYCGGFLIRDRWILTAAHCITDPDTFFAFAVSLGRTNISDPKEMDYRQQRNTRIYCTHPKYNTGSAQYNFDFALVKIDPVVYTDYVRTICIPNDSQCSYQLRSNQVDGCHGVTAAGWGNTYGGSSALSQAMKVVNLNITSRYDCRQKEAFSDLTEAQICAGSSQIPDDTCRGDSGGPLMCKVGDSTTAIGVVSFGNINCGNGQPSIYSRICSALPWINAVIKSDGDCNAPTSKQRTGATMATDTTTSIDSTTTAEYCTAPAVDYGSVFRLNGGAVSAGATLEVDAVISLRCDDGFVASSKNTGTKKCSSSGEWLPSSPEFRCLFPSGCPEVTPPIDHGSIASGSFGIGTSRAVSCDDGYTVQGVDFIRCQANRTWSQPGQCAQKSCGAPSSIYNGYIGSGGYSVGAVREIICNKGYLYDGEIYQIKCQATGQWSAPDGICSLVRTTTRSTFNIRKRPADDYYTWMTAVRSGDLEQVKRLVALGADVNKKDSNGDWTALHYCGEIGFNEIAEYLLQNGARVDEKDSEGWTPLMIACQYGRLSVAKIFVSHGANINARKNTGTTPLMIAASNGQDLMVKWLVDQSELRINALNYRNETALDFAYYQKNQNKGGSKETTYNKIIDTLQWKGASTTTMASTKSTDFFSLLFSQSQSCHRAPWIMINYLLFFLNIAFIEYYVN